MAGGSGMEVEAGELVPVRLGMPRFSGEGRGPDGAGSGGINGNGNVGEVKVEGGAVTGVSVEGEEHVGGSNVQISQRGGVGEVPQDVLLAAEAADAISKLPENGNGVGVGLESEEEGESEEEEDDENVEGMVEVDSDPLVESEESSDASSSEEEDVNANAVAQKNHNDGAEELKKMVKEKDGSSDEEEGATEPPRTVHEVTDLPPVPVIEAVLRPNQVPHEVGVVKDVMDKQVIVEASEHEMVLNEGSILWLTEQRVPLGIVDEVFGPVKKPYYVIRYNKATDVPDKASQGVTVGFVQEFANFVLNDAELRKKGYDASDQHDEEISDEEEFSDDEKEEEAKRLRKQASKQAHQVLVGGDSGRGGGRGGGGRQKSGGRGRGRGGRGRFSRSDSASMLEVDDATKARAAGMGHQRSNSVGSPVHQPRGQFLPSPDRQNSWNRSPRSDVSYSQVPDLRPPMVNYNERQSPLYQSPQYDYISGIRPIQQPPHLSPQRPAGPPHWGALEVPQVHQVQPAPYLGSNVRWPHPTTGSDSGVHLPSGGGDYQHPESMYQARVNLVPMASYPLPQISMYAPPQPVGTGVFIPPAQYTRNSQGNQHSQTQGSGQMQGSVHPSLDGRGPVGQWPVNGPSIVTGIPCYSNPPQPIYLQPGIRGPGMIAPGPSSNVYWTNNQGR